MNVAASIVYEASRILNAAVGGTRIFLGLLQEGYSVGYLVAALVYGTVFRFVGWRGMFVIGAWPAFLVIYIRTKVDESPAWLQGQVSRVCG